MSTIFSQYLVESIVSYQGINEIVLGLMWLIHSSLRLQDFFDQADRYVQIPVYIPYYYFVAVAAVLSLLKGPLLLYSIKRSNKIGVLVYFILTSLVLLIGTGFVISTGIKITAKFDFNRVSNMNMRYYIFYVFVYPILVLSFYCFCQFCVFLFYRNLSQNDYSRSVNVGTQLENA